MSYTQTQIVKPNSLTEVHDFGYPIRVFGNTIAVASSQSRVCSDI